MGAASSKSTYGYNNNSVYISIDVLPTGMAYDDQIVSVGVIIGCRNVVIDSVRVNVKVDWPLNENDTRSFDLKTWNTVWKKLSPYEIELCQMNALYPFEAYTKLWIYITDACKKYPSAIFLCNKPVQSLARLNYMFQKYTNTNDVFAYNDVICVASAFSYIPHAETTSRLRDYLSPFNVVENAEIIFKKYNTTLEEYEKMKEWKIAV